MHGPRTPSTRGCCCHQCATHAVNLGPAVPEDWGGQPGEGSQGRAAGGGQPGEAEAFRRASGEVTCVLGRMSLGEVGRKSFLN